MQVLNVNFDTSYVYLFKFNTEIGHGLRPSSGPAAELSRASVWIASFPEVVEVPVHIYTVDLFFSGRMSARMQPLLWVRKLFCCQDFSDN
jgi:hypothetical protein